MIVEADLDSAELRILAHLAQDQPFLDALAAGRKPHLDTAQILFPDRTVTKADEEYRFAKSFTYRWFYTEPDAAPSVDGGKLRTERVQITPTLLNLANQRMNQAHPAIVAWKRTRLEDLDRTGRAVSPFGRFRDLRWAVRTWDPKLKNHASNAALNFPIQSAIADIMNARFVGVYDDIQAQDLGQVVAQVHDSLVVWVPDHAQVRFEDVAAVFQAHQETLGFGAEIPWGFKVGPNWGDTEERTDV